MIDGGFGFEMETFEFLNLLQVRGGGGLEGWVGRWASARPPDLGCSSEAPR